MSFSGEFFTVKNVTCVDALNPFTIDRRSIVVNISMSSAIIAPSEDLSEVFQLQPFTSTLLQKVTIIQAGEYY